MAFLDVIRHPDPCLKKIAREVPLVDDVVRRILDDMAEIEYVYPSLSASIGMAARKFAAAAPAQHRERRAA